MENCVFFQRWLPFAVDPDRPRYVGTEESGIWASRLHVAVPAPLREGCCSSAGVHLGLGEVPHSSLPAGADWHPRARAVFLPSKDGSLLLPCEGEVAYRQRPKLWHRIKIYHSLWFYSVAGPLKALSKAFYKDWFERKTLDLKIGNY